MSFSSCYSKKVITPKCVMLTQFTKLEQGEKEVNGYIVPEYHFKTVDVSNDERKGITMHHYSLSNLKALGVDGQLKFCTAMSDTLRVADSFEKYDNHDVPQVPAEDVQKGQSK